MGLLLCPIRILQNRRFIREGKFRATRKILRAVIEIMRIRQCHTSGKNRTSCRANRGKGKQYKQCASPNAAQFSFHFHEFPLRKTCSRNTPVTQSLSALSGDSLLELQSNRERSGIFVGKLKRAQGGGIHSTVRATIGKQ